ncbi:uncharacterized protein LOC135586703 [Musa acuminata AAA Group]|uniref:uncharacterized protein LOC135586703 n=1 Tax=Musa acuminata AAA Group TaxID=214697 RepID=UPI0031CEBEB8
MDYSAFAQAQQQQQQQHQYQYHQPYDPSRSQQQVLYGAAAYQPYRPQEAYYSHHPSSTHHYHPYHHSYRPLPPPPPGTDPFLQNHAFWGPHRDNHRPPTPQTQQRPLALSKFGRAVGVGERPVAPPQHLAVGGESAHRGGSRRGRWPFRGGGGRGNVDFRPSRHDVGSPPFHGRGRGRKGRGGSRQNHLSAPVGPLPVTTPASVAESLSVIPPVMEELKAPLQSPALVAESGTLIPTRPFLPLAWCDICRVDCNSLEVLEQHKNGKRHKKTVQRIQEIQAQQKLMADLHIKYAAKPEMVLQSAEENKVSLPGEANKLFSHTDKADETVAAAFSSDQVIEAGNAVVAALNTHCTALPASSQDTEANKGSISSTTVILSEVNEANICSAALENLPPATTEMDHKMGPEMQSENITIQSDSSKEGETGSVAPTTSAPDYIDVPAAKGCGRRAGMNGYNRRHGSKRKMMRYWRNGKRLKMLEAVESNPQEHQKERPRVCTLCNVTCDTQAVFDCHLSGKKHISRIKRFQGQHTEFGPITVYIPPNQPSAHPPKALDPLFYGLRSHEMLQQEACTGGCGVQPGDQAEQGGKTEPIALGFRSQQPSEKPEGRVPITEGQNSVNMCTEGLHNAAETVSKEKSELPVAFSSGISQVDEPA